MKKNIKKFGFRGFEDYEFDSSKVCQPVADTKELEQDEMVRLIFAPDPVTGNPDASLPLLASEDSEIGRYIRSHFTENKGTENGGTDDPDLALEVAQRSFETNEQYINRIRNYMVEQRKSLSKNEGK